MKLSLPPVEETTQLKYRIPLSLKAELDVLAEQCKKHKLNFGTALTDGLRGVAKAIREELRTKSGLKVEPKAEPTHLVNGHNPTAPEEGKV
jgi:hypothetical protein